MTKRQRPRHDQTAPTAAAPRVADVQARYDVAGTGRRIARWTPPSTGPNRAITGLQRIRDRARDSSRNDWAGESGVQKWTTSLVGVGITPRWKNPKFAPLWREWAKRADADGTCDVYGQQTLAVRAWLDSGEVFLRRRPRAMNAYGRDVPLQVQLIEADFVPLFDATVWPGMPAGNQILQGIELDSHGQRIAYWMYRSHPGDGFVLVAPAASQLLRIPADDISHVFEPRRPGQMRGVPMLAPVLVKLRNALDLEDTVLDRQKLANLYTMFITRQMPEDWENLEFDPVTGLPTFYGKDGQAIASLEPGMAQELRPGEDVKFANPPDAGTSFSEFMRTAHMGTAAGAGMPYELFAGDLKDVSDRTLRISVNEFRRFAEQRQWNTIIPRICQPVLEWWTVAECLAGRISPSECDEAQNPEWSPHGWPDIHPTQDIQGRIAERDAGLTSTSAIIARKGDDPAAVLAQRQADEASGLTPKPKPALGVKALQQPKGTPPNHTRQAPEANVTQELLRQMVAMGSVLQSLVASDERQRTAGQQAAFTSSLLAVASRPINIAAPAVNITNDVQPAAVKVDVNLPERETTSVIKRDSQGDIVDVTQTHRTVKP